MNLEYAILDTTPIRLTDNQQAKCRAIAKHYGMPQLGQCIEECSELITALNKMNRLTKGQPLRNLSAQEVRDGITEEIADVLVMLEEVKFLLDIPNDEISNIIDSKLERTLNYIHEEND